MQPEQSQKEPLPPFVRLHTLPDMVGVAKELAFIKADVVKLKKLRASIKTAEDEATITDALVQIADVGVDMQVRSVEVSKILNRIKRKLEAFQEAVS